MTTEENHSFLDTIHHLRKEQEVLIYNAMVNISQQEYDEVIDYLGREYENELLEYPSSAPGFDGKAALWGAKIIYFSAQLLLNRKNLPDSVQSYLPVYDGEHSAEAALSVDLCLRFLPDLIKELKIIDPEDDVIEVLMAHLNTWHYSGIGMLEGIENLDYATYIKNNCLRQCYVDRIIDKKVRSYAEKTEWKEFVMGSLGNYADQYWKEL